MDSLIDLILLKSALEQPDTPSEVINMPSVLLLCNSCLMSGLLFVWSTFGSHIYSVHIVKQTYAFIHIYSTTDNCTILSFLSVTYYNGFFDTLAPFKVCMEAIRATFRNNQHTNSLICPVSCLICCFHGSYIMQHILYMKP